MRLFRVQLLAIVPALIAAVTLTSCVAESGSVHSPVADGDKDQTEAPRDPGIHDATISMKIDGTDVPVEEIRCVRGTVGDSTYFNNDSPDDPGNVDIRFDENEELTFLLFKKDFEFVLAWDSGQANAADSDLTSTVDGDTYTVTGDTPNNADPGAKVAVEVTATCG